MKLISATNIFNYLIANVVMNLQAFRSEFTTFITNEYWIKLIPKINSDNIHLIWYFMRIVLILHCIGPIIFFPLDQWIVICAKFKSRWMQAFMDSMPIIIQKATKIPIIWINKMQRKSYFVVIIGAIFGGNSLKT